MDISLCGAVRLLLSLITAVQSTIPPSETLTSLTLEHLFTWAGASCYSYTGSGGDGLQACQVGHFKTKLLQSNILALFQYLHVEAYGSIEIV